MALQKEWSCTQNGLSTQNGPATQIVPAHRMSLQTELASNSIRGKTSFQRFMTPLNFVKIVFQNFFLFNAPEGFLPIFKNKY
jgi:hypothetical protein